MASFDALFPTFLQRCADLRVVLLVVAYMLVIVGIIVTAMRRPSVRAWTRYFVRVIVVMSLLVLLPQWGDQIQQVVADTVTNTLKANPDQIYQVYKDTLAIKHSETEPNGLWDLIASGTSYLVNAVIAGLLWLLAFAASLLLFWAYIFQKIILNVGYALSPILIGFVAVPALSGTGSRYLMNLVGVLLWPLGWGVAALISQGILDFMTDQSFLTIDPTSSLYSLQNLLGLAVLAFWTVFSTCASPVIIQKVLTYGVEAGSALLSGGFSTFLQTAATTAAATAVAAPVGKPLVTAATAGIAATLSSLSLSTGMGSAGAIIIAGSGLPPRTARGRPGDDITGDKAVRELIAVSRNQAL
ncbi:MAG: hypothetical protein L0Z50_37705 [Verrucomicrobiales bacterium]|nr:hypothetical protein [Verrucomicrobiales bacterium]